MLNTWKDIKEKIRFQKECCIESVRSMILDMGVGVHKGTPEFAQPVVQ